MNQIFWYECGASGGSLTNNLIGYYKFENNVADSTGMLPTATGTLVDFVAGKIGNAVRFDAADNRVDIPDTNLLSFTSGSGNDIPFSISTWVYITAVSATGNWFINKRTTVSGGDEWQFIYLGGRVVFGKFDRVSNAIVQAVGTPATPLTLNTWYHLTITDDGSKTVSGMKIYINGVSQTLTNMSSGVYTGMPNGTSITRMGQSAWSVTAGTQHQGYIDETGIWRNRVLTQSEVNSLYNSGTGITYPF